VGSPDLCTYRKLGLEVKQANHGVQHLVSVASFPFCKPSVLCNPFECLGIADFKGATVPSSGGQEVCSC
jgi:hypothetical protein